MTLNAIQYSGFKCFSEYTLPLKPLTVLTGFNAAGKSTAVQPLLAMAQTLRRGVDSSRLSLNGCFVDLGTPADVISRAAEFERIALGFSSDGGEIANWTFDYDRTTDTRYLRLSKAVRSGDGSSEEWNDRIWPAAANESDLLHLIKNAIFISASRTSKVEAYPVPGDASTPTADVGSQGEFAPFWYAENADDEVDDARRHPSELGTVVRSQTDAWLGEFFPGARVEAALLETGSLVRLSFRMSRSGDLLRPTNVGYGLSYAFPIIVACLLAPRGAAMIIDSPEAHLHPRAQSEMGRFLARVAGAGVQIIVETHSDHFLAGTRLGVREGLIPDENVQIHFLRSADGPNGNPDVVKINIDPEGSVSDWPEGFFDQSERDLAILSGWA